MSDNLQVTEGTGPFVAADERTIGGDTVKVQRVDGIGADQFAADEVTVDDDVAYEVAFARDTRNTLTILSDPDNDADLYLGDSSVDAFTPGDRFRLVPGAALSLPTTDAVYAMSANGAQTVFVVETYS